MNFFEMTAVVDEAKRTVANVDALCGQMARLLVGRLRKATAYDSGKVLSDLKRELRAFDMTTKTWKD